MVVGVWVGNNLNQPMDGIAGSLGAAPIWKDLMERALLGTPVENFEPPDDIVKLTVCGLSDYFVKGTEPPKCIYKPKTATPSASL